MLSERHVWRKCAPIYPPAIEVSKHLNALLFLLHDGVEKVGEDGVVAESEPVQGLGACTEQVSKSASCVTLHPSMMQDLLTGRPHLDKLSGVARVLVPARTAKAITPRGTRWMVACQLMS